MAERRRGTPRPRAKATSAKAAAPAAVGNLMRKPTPKEREREEKEIAQLRTEWLQEIDGLESFYLDRHRRNVKRWLRGFKSVSEESAWYHITIATNEILRTLPIAREKAQQDTWFPSSELRWIRRRHVEVTTELHRQNIAKEKLRSAKGTDKNKAKGSETRSRVAAMAQNVRRDLPDACDRAIRKEIKVRLDRDFSGRRSISTKSINNYYRQLLPE